MAPEATEGVVATFGAEHIFETLDALLAHPEIEVIDIATHASVRPPLVHRALEAGKHVLSHKPFATDLRTAQGMVDAAERRGLKLAVNQNGRWSPAWRVATLLVREGVVGDVVAVTHLYDHNFHFVVGSAFDDLEHAVLYDYSVHWIDITRCWLEGKEVSAVRARDYRTPNQPAESKTPWGAWIVVEYADGSSAMIRGVGCSQTRRPEKPFWIHGSDGTIRGRVLGSGHMPGSESVELERDGRTVGFQLDGRWNPDGFAGAMGELLTAIAEDREPFNSARHNLLSLRMTLAACRSADEGGRPVRLDEVPD